MKQLFTAVLSVGLLSALSAQVQVVRGPYLQSPTSNSVKILWRTDAPATSSVSVGSSPQSLTLHFGDSVLKTDHSVTVTGLNASTTYFYSVNNVDGNQFGPDFRFKTFPAAGTSPDFRVWAMGDFGKGNSSQQKVRDAYLNYSANKETDLWIWLGDNVYPDGRDEEYQAYVFDSVWGYKKIMTYLPFMPTPGNHDYNVISPVTGSVAPLSQTGPYLNMVDPPINGEAGGVASGTKLYYSFNYGNVHFVSINSELGSLYNASHDWIGIRLFGTFTGSPMMTWLQQDLAANTLPWTVVFFHQPPHTDGSHDSEAFWEVYMKAMREKWTPVLEQYGVDLVLCGHSHVYERSYLMQGLYGNLNTFNSNMILQSTGGSDATGGPYVKYLDGPQANKGTVYVVNGNSGSKETNPNLQHPAMFTAYGCDTCIGSLVLDFSGNRVDGYHIDGNGVERDHFTIIKTTYPAGLEESKKDVIKWAVAPNPFGKETRLTYTLDKEASVSIFLTDMHGKKYPLLSDKKAAGDYELLIDADRLGLAVGAYTLFIETGGKTVARTIMRLN